MLNALFERSIRATERQVGESADWLREVLKSSRGAFIKFGLFMPLAKHRLSAPLELWHVARIATNAAEDCGPCLNITVRHALAEGVDRRLVAAAARGDLDALPLSAARVWRYARAVVEADPEAAALGDAVADEIGRDGLVELALAIATVRVFPTMKRALGYARSCSLTPLALPEAATEDKVVHAA